MRMNVFINARLGWRTSRPAGQLVADARINAYAENNEPNSMISDARKSQIPSVTLVAPVSPRRSVVYGIMAATAAGSRRLAPGTL